MLNASRHHGEQRLAKGASKAAVARSLCSTPLGITANSAASVLTLERHSSAGAQRLSASRRTARAEMSDAILNTEAVCSTPLGITANSAIPRACAHTGRATLCSTPLGITANSASSRRSARGTSRCSAQRLSASRRTAHRLRELALVLGAVVCSTPLGITANSAARLAFPLEPQGGAQRLSASRRTAHTQRMICFCHSLNTCSTPLGITANSA